MASPLVEVLVLICLYAIAVVKAAVTYTNLDDIPPPTSLADAFKVSLVRPPGEPANSGSKLIVNASALQLLEEDEVRILEGYDEIFEKYSLFCNGRWLGAQVLQDSQDLMYLQHVVYMRKPDVIIETGTYKGGLTYFFATLLDWIDREPMHDKVVRDTKILSVDRHHPDLVYAANWFCPVCIDCVRPYTTDVWERKVRFIGGLADSETVYSQIVDHLFDLGFLRMTNKVTGELVSDDSVRIPEIGGVLDSDVAVTMDSSKTVVVNLDANHEYEGLVKELLFYAPFVTENSYLIVQDTKLDSIWGTAGPTAALNRFLSLAPEGEFVVEPELKFHAYSQHTYLRRVRVTVHYTYFVEKIAALARQMEAER